MTTLNSELIKGNPKIRLYRNYRNFDVEAFKQDLNNILKHPQRTDYFYSQNMFTWVLNKHAPPKKENIKIE